MTRRATLTDRNEVLSTVTNYSSEHVSRITNALRIPRVDGGSTSEMGYFMCYCCCCCYCSRKMPLSLIEYVIRLMKSVSVWAEFICIQPNRINFFIVHKIYNFFVAKFIITYSFTE